MALRRRSTIALAISLAAALALSGAELLSDAAHASTVSPESPSVASQVRRNVTFVLPPKAPRTLFIDSRSVDAPSPDEFQITYADGNFTLSYRRTQGGPITSQYTLTVRGLVEWNDTHGDGQMEDGSIVAYTPMGPGAFGRFAIQHSQRTTGDGIAVNSFVIVSNRGDLTLNLTITDGFLALPSGQNLTPMEAKLTLDIFHNMTMPDTHLSLQLGLSTDQRISLENRSWDDLNDFSSDDRALNVSNEVGSASSAAFFAWSNSASVNGQPGPVTTSGPDVNGTSGDYDFYLSYARPTADLQLRVVHDPAMGVVSAAYLSTLHPGPGPALPFVGDALLYGVSLAGIAALLGATAILVNRRRRRDL